jgi:ubiquinol-cytochrome c reductase cytochrome c1 subunit
MLHRFKIVLPITILQLKQITKCSSEDHIPSLDYGWNHHGTMASFDYASIRRGFQVYRQVCSSCHSIDKITFRSLVNVTHDEIQMKKIAESYDLEDGPNENGDMFERPGKLSDLIPGPYKNEEQVFSFISIRSFV